MEVVNDRWVGYLYMFPHSHDSFVSLRVVVPNPLVLTGDPPQPGMILIKNDGNMSVQVAVSNATSSGSRIFYVISPGGAENWMRAGNETVFVSGQGYGHVAIGIVKPGSYVIQKME